MNDGPSDQARRSPLMRPGDGSSGVNFIRNGNEAEIQGITVMTKVVVELFADR